jgi:hypothetical protein
MTVTMLATSHDRAELAAADAALIWDDLGGHHPEELPWHSTSR